MEKFLINLGLAALQKFIFPLVDRLWDWVTDKINNFYKKREDNKRIDKSTGKLVDAETGEEIDDAADSILDDL